MIHNKKNLTVLELRCLYHMICDSPSSKLLLFPYSDYPHDKEKVKKDNL